MSSAKLVTGLLVLGAVVLAGSYVTWRQSDHAVAPHAQSDVGIQGNAVSEPIERHTKETWAALEAVQAKKGGEVFDNDSWVEPRCGGILVFYYPPLQRKASGWFWVDSATQRVVDWTPASAVLAVLGDSVNGFGQNINDSIFLSEGPDGRTQFMMGTAGEKGELSILVGFSGHHCDSTPDIVLQFERLNPQRQSLPLDIYGEVRRLR